MSGVKAAHHRGNYQTRAARVRAAANADPTTRCWRCDGLTRPDDPWTAGHIVDSHPDSPLAAEHASCNYSAGATLGNRRRQGLDPVILW